jgi:GNAT superfamily N-acetyltransferase
MTVAADLERIDMLDARQLDDLLELYRHGWWTRDRDRDEVERLLAEADVVVGYREPTTCRLVAFARVRIPEPERALVMDVLVAPEYRKHGIGSRVVDAIVRHRSLRQVRHFDLNCRPEIVRFYVRHGFVEDVRIGRMCFLRLSRNPG